MQLPMKKYLGLLAVLAAPAVAFAQNPSQLFGLLNITKTVLNYIIPILITFAVIYFIWGVISYVIAKDEEARKESRDKIIYGVIGIFVIVAIWGLVGFLSTTLGVGVGGTAGLPCVDQNPMTPACD
jgi:uncharacterized membrane protein YfcA